MTWLTELATAARRGMTPKVREQLWQRGVSDAQMEAFHMGCLRELPEGVECSSRFSTWWQKHRGNFTKYVLIFPLTNTLGAVHGFQFRDLNQKVRGYLDYFEVKEEPAFFGLAQAMPSVWASETVWLVEGAFDLYALQRHVPNIFSTLHAGISAPLKTLLRRLVRTIVLAYDMDSKGRDVSYELVRELRDVFDVKIVKFPRVPRASGGTTKDPNELWEAWGDEALGEFIRKWARDFVVSSGT